ncbi:MAG: hypothetical protein AAFY17_12280 [Cyanobacteria bacterium J06642_11]
MSDKQKVTLYLPPDLHRKLRVQSALDGEAMSAIAERAIGFYLEHADLVESTERYGHTHQVYSCPACTTPVVLSGGDLTTLAEQSPIESIESADAFKAGAVQELVQTARRSEEEDGAEQSELVTC